MNSININKRCAIACSKPHAVEEGSMHGWDTCRGVSKNQGSLVGFLFRTIGPSGHRRARPISANTHLLCALSSP